MEGKIYFGYSNEMTQNTKGEERKPGLTYNLLLLKKSDEIYSINFRRNGLASKNSVCIIKCK